MCEATSQLTCADAKEKSENGYVHVSVTAAFYLVWHVSFRDRTMVLSTCNVLEDMVAYLL